MLPIVSVPTTQLSPFLSPPPANSLWQHKLRYRQFFFIKLQFSRMLLYLLGKPFC